MLERFDREVVEVPLGQAVGKCWRWYYEKNRVFLSVCSGTIYSEWTIKSMEKRGI
jgi:hypothetical protein